MKDHILLILINFDLMMWEYFEEKIDVGHSKDLKL